MEVLKLHIPYEPDEDTSREVSRAVADDMYAGAPPPEEWIPSPEDEERVERYLRALRYYRGELERVNKAADEEQRRIDAWRHKHALQAVGSIGYLEYMLRLFSEATGRQKRVSPSGTLKWHKGSEHVEVADPKHFCTLHSNGQFVRIKQEPDKSAIIAHVRNTGEVPTGADVVRGEDSFIVSTPKEA